MEPEVGSSIPRLASVALALVAPVLFLPHKGSRSFLLFTLPPDVISLTSIKYSTVMGTYAAKHNQFIEQGGVNNQLQYKSQGANHIY